MPKWPLWGCFSAVWASGSYLGSPGTCHVSQLLGFLLYLDSEHGRHNRGVTLVEFVEVSADGTFSILCGRPRALTPFTFGSNYWAALRSVGWRPYKLVDSCSPANPQALNSRPVMDCSLEYCNRFGWYYRYLQIVKVPGPPNIFLSQLNNAPCTYM